jgi:hypothetical protein
MTTNITVISNSRLLSKGAAQAYFSAMRKQMNAENSGMPSTHRIIHGEASEEIDSVNFFLLNR